MIAAIALASGAAYAGTEFADVPSPVFNTGVVLSKNTGKMEWLDATTLAITTYQTGDEYWNGKIVAVDMRDKSVVKVLDNGFLQCTNPDASVVAAIKGSLGGTYRGDAKSAGAVKPEPVFYRWAPKAKMLLDEEQAAKMPWNWHDCIQTAPGHRNQSGRMQGFPGAVYLRSRDGVLAWQFDPDRKPVPVSWLKPKAAPKQIQAASDEIGPVAVYQPYDDSYLLAPGRFGNFMHRGKMVDQAPAVTMDSAGTVKRTPLPASLKAYFDRQKGNGGYTQPTPAGLLVYAYPFSGGGGFYLANGNSVKRIWCTENSDSADNCSPNNATLSPDGCRLAFVNRSYPGTVEVLTLCSGR